MPYHSFRSRGIRVTGAVFLVWLSLALPAFAQAPSAGQPTSQSKWNDAVAALVEKIAASPGAPQAATLKINNISSLNAMDVSAIEQALESELSKHFHLVPAGTVATQITVTLSEGVNGYVCVARVRSADSEQTQMVLIPKQASEAGRERPAVSLERKLIWAQPQPFLDFALPEGVPATGPSLILLETSRIGFYKWRDGKWMAGKSVALASAAIPPRNARGMIWQSGEEIEMFAPGESCSAIAATLPELVCAGYPSTNPAVNWPLVTGGTKRQDAQFESNRDFFAGLVSVNGTVDDSVPGFYTAAAKATADGTDWLIAAVDGKARLYDGSKRLAATFSGWGDELATIDTGCDDSWQVLTTGAGDSLEADHIQMYDIRNYPQTQAPASSSGSQGEAVPPEAVALGQPLDFSGPILALWSSGDLRSARVVSLNLQTGMYEGSIISVSCGE